LTAVQDGTLELADNLDMGGAEREVEGAGADEERLDEQQEVTTALAA
jgi:hypothetical protein